MTFALLLAALTLAHGDHKHPAEPDKRAPVDASATADEIWKARCQACHERGKRLEDLRSASWHNMHDDASLRWSIENGVSGTKMKAFKGKMSDAQLEAMVAKIRSFRPKP